MRCQPLCIGETRVYLSVATDRCSSSLHPNCKLTWVFSFVSLADFLNTTNLPHLWNLSIETVLTTEISLNPQVILKHRHWTKGEKGKIYCLLHPWFGHVVQLMDYTKHYRIFTSYYVSPFILFIGDTFILTSRPMNSNKWKGTKSIYLYLLIQF